MSPQDSSRGGAKGFALDPTHTDPLRLKREREKAREYKKTQDWKQKVAAGVCMHCGEVFEPKELTLDHLMPLARGGTSHPSNCVPSCRPCNQAKKLESPLDSLFDQIARERGEDPQ
jgi:5-methylcytosine-specific restriction protein A